MNRVLNPIFPELESFVKDIPVNFSQGGEIIYDGRNQLRVYRVSGMNVVVKRFRRPHLINRIAYTFFRSSKAKRSYQYALQLLEKGISTPSPIAYIEDHTFGLLAYSYYICIFEQDYSHIRKQMLGEDFSYEFIKDLASFVGTMHNKGVHHQDLSPGNVLFRMENGHATFSVVDINRMKFVAEMDARTRYFSFRRISENRQILSSLAKEYAIFCSLDEQEAIHYITKYCQDFIKTDLY